MMKQAKDLPGTGKFFPSTAAGKTTSQTTPQKAPPEGEGYGGGGSQFTQDIQTVGKPPTSTYTDLGTGLDKSFTPRTSTEVAARNRLGRWSIAAPKREFFRKGAEATRGAKDIATQEILKGSGKTAEDIKALRTDAPDEFQRMKAERDMRMQNLLNPDRPQFKPEDLSKVMDDGKWTGAYAPDVASREQREFGEKRAEKLQGGAKILKDASGNVVGFSKGKSVKPEELEKADPRIKKIQGDIKAESERRQMDEAARQGRLKGVVKDDQRGFFPDPVKMPTGDGGPPPVKMPTPAKKKPKKRFFSKR